MSDPGAVEAALKRLFPASVASAAERIDPREVDGLWPEERAAVARAVPRRVAEFAAGRRAARRVLERLGLPPAPLPAAPDRSALWPAGVFGSIAHETGLAVAVGHCSGPVGVDIEPDAPLPEDLWSTICTSSELERLPADRGRSVRRVFCAKEAVFKAQPPQDRRLFGFDALEITLADCGFDAQFRISVGAFRAGQVLTGRLTTVEGVILAGVAWGG